MCPPNSQTNFMNMDNEDLIHRLMKKTENKFSVSAVYKYYKDISAFTEAGDILSILGLDRNLLPSSVLEIIDFLEKGNGYDSSNYLDLKWKLSAFLNIQDIFDHPIYENEDMFTSFHLWYFYFESKYILIESFLSGLNGLYLSSKVLLRLFIEFNITQNYYYRMIMKTGNYQCVNKYFKDGVRPKFDTMMKNVLPDDKFSKPIKHRLHIHWAALSSMPAHLYHPDMSEKKYSGFLPRICAEGIFFWFYHRLVLEAILWIYYVNFPMLFQPVNSLEKYGFNGPIGVFIDPTIGHIVKRSMTENDFDLFLNYSNNSQYVSEVLTNYYSMNTLSEEQIIESWNRIDEPFDGIEKSYVKLMSKQRVTKELLSFPQFNKSQDKNNDLDFNIFNYENWKESYKKYR